jgi:hypothetical protein
MQIEVSTKTGGRESINVDKYPNICPHCHKSITAQLQLGFTKDDSAEVIFRCPDESCRSVFVGYYNHQFANAGWMHVYLKTSLGSVRARDFSGNIQEVSRSFVDIYNQAIVAEGHELHHITGIGLRKALEFLIKDYLIKKKPEKREEIEKKFLSNCIKDYITNPNIKDMSEEQYGSGMTRPIIQKSGRTKTLET